MKGATAVLLATLLVARLPNQLNLRLVTNTISLMQLLIYSNLHFRLLITKNVKFNVN